MKKVPLDLPSVTVVERRQWPRLSHGYGGKNVTIPKSVLLHTTQHYVHPAKVDEKKEAIRLGEAPRVELARDPIGRYWILDGHHTLVAYEQLGLTPRAFLWEPGSAIHPKPPRYQGEGRR